jgi:hypothetical protein
MSAERTYDVVEQALRVLLGRDPEPSDVKGFVSAL